MPFDGLATAKISQELHQELQNSRVMRVYQPDRHTIHLHLRLPGENRVLAIAAESGRARLHTTTEQRENPLTPPAFCMLLRKYLEPSRIMAIQQKDFERIVYIVLETHNESGGRDEKTLILEAMGRHSNVLLTHADGRILDALFRFPPEANAARVIMPQTTYQHPPAQGKKDAAKVTKEVFLTDLRLMERNTTVKKGLQDLYQGLGPFAAQEIVARAGLATKTVRQGTSEADWHRLWECLQVILEAVRPDTPAYMGTYRGKPDFFAYPTVQVEETTEYPNLDTVLDSFYTERVKAERIQKEASALSRQLQTYLKRLKRKEGLQKQALGEANQADQWRKYGELITANLHAFDKGMKSATVVDYYDAEQPALVIPLDSTLSPSDNAQRYFKRYRKAQRSQKHTKQQLRKAQAERRYLEETLVHIALADSIETLAEIREELVNEGYIKPPRKAKRVPKRAAAGWDEYVSSAGSSILVGRNNSQNDALTFRVARPNDLWFHAQKIAGSHVVLRNQGAVAEECIAEAALLAAFFSKARTSPKVTVDYTERRYVRKPQGARPGFVIYDHFQSILVNPAETSLPRRLPRRTAANTE